MRSSIRSGVRREESLLSAVAAEAWTDLGDQLQTLAAKKDPPPKASLHTALTSLRATGRSRQHLYRLMFTQPAGDPTAVVRAAERTQDLFLELVARVAGHTEPDATGRFSWPVHGIAAPGQIDKPSTLATGYRGATTSLNAWVPSTRSMSRRSAVPVPGCGRNSTSRWPDGGLRTTSHCRSSRTT